LHKSAVKPLKSFTRVNLCASWKVRAEVPFATKNAAFRGARWQMAYRVTTTHASTSRAHKRETIELARETHRPRVERTIRPRSYGEAGNASWRRPRIGQSGSIAARRRIGWSSRAGDLDPASDEDFNDHMLQSELKLDWTRTECGDEDGLDAD
jgi:hypothetical protein